MPAFLDWKMNHIPENLDGYYDTNNVIDAMVNLKNGESITHSTQRA
jgi:hypothetical protein